VNRRISLIERQISEIALSFFFIDKRKKVLIRIPSKTILTPNKKFGIWCQMDSRIFFSIKEEDKQEIIAAINVLNNKLSPLSIELAQGEERELALMGDKSYAFVHKTFEFTKQYPEYATFMNLVEFEKDVNVIELLREFHVPLSQLTKKVHDTMALAGNEAFVAALAYYGSAKEDVKRKQLNTVLIVEELGKRFQRNPKRKKDK
jgi:hypothetical protein